MSERRITTTAQGVIVRFARLEFAGITALTTSCVGCIAG
jgi:hypothetical protein